MNSAMLRSLQSAPYRRSFSCCWIVAIISVLTKALTCFGETTEVAPTPPPPKPSLTSPIGDWARDSIFKPVAPFQLVPEKDPNGWGFVLEPYVWAMGLSGDVGVDGLPPMGLRFDSRSIIQDLDWGIFARGEVRKGRWGLLADGYYAALSGSSDLGNVLYKSGTLQVQQSIVSLALSYRLIDDRRGFLDFYAGARYNFLGLQASAETSSSGIDSLSNGITDRISDRIQAQVRTAVESVRSEVAAAVDERVATARRGIDADVTKDLSTLRSKITEDARSRLQSEDLERVLGTAEKRKDVRMLRALRDLDLGPFQRSRSDRELRERGIDPRRVMHLRRVYEDLTTLESFERPEIGRDRRSEGRSQRRNRGAMADYFRATVDLEIARVRGEATADSERRAANAKSRAAKELASNIDEALPTEAAGDQWWIDPIVGMRGQVNVTRWLFLAAQADVGGFGAGSQIAWNVQTTVGFNITRNIFAELGYRYMYVDYQNSGFLYQMNSYGIYSGFGVKF